MATYYEQVFSYNGETFKITVQVHTETITVDDVDVTANKVIIDHYDTTQTSGPVRDENLLQYLSDALASEKATIDGIPDPALDQALIDAGYTRL